MYSKRSKIKVGRLLEWNLNMKDFLICVLLVVGWDIRGRII